eukprot:6200963-Pleurochrysis_carterae.AAC.1
MGVGRRSTRVGRRECQGSGRGLAHLHLFLSAVLRLWLFSPSLADVGRSMDQAYAATSHAPA